MEGGLDWKIRKYGKNPMLLNLMLEQQKEAKEISFLIQKVKL